MQILMFCPRGSNAFIKGGHPRPPNGRKNMINLFLLVVAAGLVLLNSFFVAAEFGMVKLRNTRVEAIKKKYGFRGKILAEVHQHLDAYLSACQLGITLASLGLGWIGEPALAKLLEPFFHKIGIVSPDFINVISFVVAFSFLSYLHIVVGELMPKSLAIRQSERVSTWTAVPLYVFYWVMYPGIWLLNISSNFLLKVMGLDVVHKGERYYSTEEIKMILSASHLYGELTKEETEILEHTLDFADLTVAEIMRPIEEILAIDIHQPIKKILDIVAEYRYSRYPVYDKKISAVIGILHVKDLFLTLYQKKEIHSIKPLLHPVFKVADDMLATRLLRKFREGKSHFALVYQDEEKLVGFATLDNLFHVLVGRIKDEFHRTRDEWIEEKDGSLIMKGKSSIYTLERALKKEIQIPTNEEEIEIKTIAGLIMAKSGAVPKTGDRISFPEFDAVVEKMRGPHIQWVRIYPAR